MRVEAELGAELPKVLGRLLDRLDAVVEVERLAARSCSRGDLAHELLLVLADVGSDRAAALRGVSMTLMSRSPARDMCRVRGSASPREDVELESQLAEQLLLGDAEALLLVDDDEAEVPATTSRDSTRCVPMRTSTFPAAKPRRRSSRRPACESG